MLIILSELWNSLVSEELFQQVYDTNGHYNANSQLAEMIALLGPPPSALLRRPKAFLELNWPRPVTNDTGKLWHNVQELFGGPFFDTEGELITTFNATPGIPTVEDESLHSELVPHRGRMRQPYSANRRIERYLYLLFNKCLPGSRRRGRQLGN
jgi:hypothetical protein